MYQIKTAREILALIEKKYFRGAGLDKASRLEGDERRAFRLSLNRSLKRAVLSSPRIRNFVPFDITFRRWRAG